MAMGPSSPGSFPDDDRSSADWGVEQEAHEQIRDIVHATDRSETETIRALLEFGTEQLGVERGLLTRIRPGPGTVEVAESTGTVPEALSGTLALSNTFCRRVIAGGEVFGVYDAQVESERSDPACEVHGLECYIGEKVLTGGELYGTACFVDTTPREEPFSEHEIALVRLIARCIGQQLDAPASASDQASRATLQQDRALLRQVEKVARVGGWALDLATQELTATREVYRIHEVPPETSSEPEEAIQFYAPEARPRLREALNQCIEEGIPYDLELPFDTANGTRRWVRTRGERLTDEEGAPVAVIGTIQDVTEWRELRERLRGQRDLLQSINENVSEGIYRARPGEGFLYANQALADMFGYDTVEEIQACAPEGLYANPERRGALLQADEQADRGTREVEFQRKDGTTFPGRLSGTVVRDESGDIAYVDGVITDLTEVKQQQRELRLLKKVVEQVDEAVLITEGAPLDPPGPRIEYVNPGFTAMTGYEPEEGQGESPRLLQGANMEPAVLRRLRARLDAEEQFEGETINYRKDGTPYVSQWTITPVRDDDGTVTHWASIQRDVTEKRLVWKKLLDVQNEERRRIDQEMHDHMGGLLASLQMKVELARMSSDTDEGDAHLNEVEDLVQELASVARTISRQLNPQILRENGLYEALGQLKTTVEDDVHVDVTYDVDRDQEMASVVVQTAFRVVQEALLNVVEHAETDKARVTVERTSENLHVSVEDAGRGFDPDRMEDSSPSLGLNGVREAVERLGGTFALEAAAGDGTCVRATLPIHIAPLPEQGSGDRFEF
jgi:PAS domain S-box-containing protein